jgi:hypothetical protein
MIVEGEIIGYYWEIKFVDLTGDGTGIRYMTPEIDLFQSRRDDK